MYLDDAVGAIREQIPKERLPEGDADDLLMMYAVLLRAKGSSVTQSDVHDAWSAWMAGRDGAHASLIPYSDLPEDVQEQDRVFTAAIRDAAVHLGLTAPSNASFSETLFPAGPPKEEEANKQAFELYKMMVQSSEGLVNRRQAVNTFFLTINGALLTASGLIVQSSGDQQLGGWGVCVLATAGALLCLAWRSLITSFGQLNSGKFRVINTMERHFAASIYAAEWEALGRGQNPQVYRSFTSREIWVPNALLALHLLATVAAISVAVGLLSLGSQSPKDADIYRLTQATAAGLCERSCA